ncbi:MAG: flagellar hook-basal body complex protein FliE [Desulfovibrionaceae bacterium]|nr:flagellar hook-basal body complex protein FliE [Desulfovibrionaceae bacterium]
MTAAAPGLQAYRNALADFTKARNQALKSAADIAGATPPVTPGFAETLRDSLTTVNDMQTQKKTMIEAFASGETQNVHELMITMQKAGLAVNLTSAVRNKVLEAYRELSRLQF